MGDKNCSFVNSKNEWRKTCDPKIIHKMFCLYFFDLLDCPYSEISFVLKSCELIKSCDLSNANWCFDAIA